MHEDPNFNRILADKLNITNTYPVTVQQSTLF